MRSFKRFVGVEEEEEPPISEQLDECFSLSIKNRIIGFAICAAIGFGFSLLACLFIFSLATGSPTPFAVFYTLGNIFMLCSTGFLVGPLKQIKNMCAKTRVIASIIYVVAIGLTLVSAFVAESAILVILCLIIQLLALTWYTLSYIPGARFIVKKCLGSLV